MRRGSVPASLRHSLGDRSRVMLGHILSLPVLCVLLPRVEGGHQEPSLSKCWCVLPSSARYRRYEVTSAYLGFARVRSPSRLDPSWRPSWMNAFLLDAFLQQCEVDVRGGMLPQTSLCKYVGSLVCIFHVSTAATRHGRNLFLLPWCGCFLATCRWVGFQVR